MLKLSSASSSVAYLFLLLVVARTTTTTTAMTDSATGIAFAPKKNGLEIFGVGARKKGPIKVRSDALGDLRGLQANYSLHVPARLTPKSTQ